MYFFESDVYPVIYGFDKPVPVNIYNGELKIDFTNIARWLKAVSYTHLTLPTIA